MEENERIDSKNLPSISIVIPTYNSERTLGQCLDSIRRQNYSKNRIEIILIDGGSKDQTLLIAKKFGINKLLNNPLRTGEAGKAVGVKASTNEIILFQDSDNVLNEENWLKQMVNPFRNEDIVGVEPLHYTYRTQDSFVSRYCALLGMNDPLCLYMGNYDRYCYITGKWTELSIRTKDYNNYLLLELDDNNIPTIGANGFLVRANALKELQYEPYLFDVDIIYQLIKNQQNKFAKVKIGIVHLFANDITTFTRKTHRRIRDYLLYDRLGMRKYPWKRNRIGVLRFVLYTLIVVPIATDSIKGYKKMPDRAWFFHPLACWLTLLIYGIKFVISAI
ncbi:MAG: glycosyltransferase family 2 protein [Thaumarchaeota archaeon]|nr:glycosyltransferase family 2 protein [Nitrososphaerota archaeon]MCL5318561.1 glycosyltransferase family 2 protein [Nitrososphaerota archaeon]